MKPGVMQHNWIPALLIVLGACARLVPHPWNFTPIMAMALYAEARSTKFRTAPLVIGTKLQAA
jgi:hypothetical protein